jgi:anti-anti-sigma regulatory factor
MVLKIETVPDRQHTILRLSGRIESQHVQDLTAQTEGRTHGIVFDLEEVRVVDLDVVHFLAVSEAKGIKLRHCPRYVREWIIQEKARIKELE